MLFNTKKYLLTCYRIISSKELNINIEIWNKHLFKFILLKRNIIFLPDPIDITIIEIKDSDEFIKDIDFLDYDSNYEKGYQRYKGENILNIGYPNGGPMSTASGTIKKIIDIEFYHK